MKITKRQLRRIIREEKALIAEECPASNPEMPCPVAAASDLRSSGASEGDVLDWIQSLLSAFQEGPEEEEFSFTGDVGQLPGEEAFGIGYEAGRIGEA